MELDKNLKQFATETQWKYITALHEHDSQRKAAKALGVSPGTIQGAYDRVKRKAATQSHNVGGGIIVKVPDPYIIRGTSDLYKDGVLKMGWVKTQLSDQKFKAMMDAVLEGMKDEIPRALPVNSKPKKYAEHLCNLITMTDSHVGMLAWHKEGGDDWDLTIAEKTLVGCFEQMILSAPKAKICFINQLGDWLHTDGMSPVTPTSHNVLDADSRYSKMVQTAIKIIRRLVHIALTHHDKVVLLLCEGNHDIVGSIWLRAMFKALYENEPRIQVIDSELPYYTYQHGKTMLAFHHGHLSKNDSLPLLFASQFPQIWGNTTKRYAHTGHRHHVEEKEHSGMTVTQHATLAARDAYAARGGWIAERQAQCITYHSEFGQVARNIVTPEMVVSL